MQRLCRLASAFFACDATVHYRTLSVLLVESRLLPPVWRRFTASPFAVAGAYAACVLIWGTTWLAIKISLGGLPPIIGAGVRFIIAGCVLYALAMALRIDIRKHAPPLHLVIVLALTMFGINYALTYLAETHLASGLVAVLFGTMPFFIFAFAHVLVGERFDRMTFAGALVALCGVALISLVGNLRGDLSYIIVALVAAASSGFSNVYLKRFSQAEPLTTLPPAMLLAGIALTLLGSAFEHVTWQRAVAPPSLGALAYLAVCGSAIAFYFNHWLLQRIPSSKVGLSALMIPVIAVTVGAVFGGEIFNSRDLAGAFLVIAGIWLALRRRERQAGTVATVEAQAVA